MYEVSKMNIPLLQTHQNTGHGVPDFSHGECRVELICLVR